MWSQKKVGKQLLQGALSALSKVCAGNRKLLLPLQHLAKESFVNIPLMCI